jgi:hypothetical protein
MFKALYSNRFTNLKTKIIIYKSLLKPIWIYGLQLWPKSQIPTKFKHSKIFHSVRSQMRLFFVSNHTFHTDLHIKTINEEAKTFYSRFHLKLSNHSSKIFLSQPFLKILNIGRKKHGVMSFFN